jgi:hypothetical protein
MGIVEGFWDDEEVFYFRGFFSTLLKKFLTILFLKKN